MLEVYTLPGTLDHEPKIVRIAPDVTLRTMESDQAYFARRAGEERETALAAADPQVRGIHLELAERYALLSAAISEAFDQLG